MRKKGWVYLVLSIIFAVFMFLVIGIAGAEPAWKRILREERSGKKVKIECRFSHYSYVRKRGKVVKVPVTVCEER